MATRLLNKVVGPGCSRALRTLSVDDTQKRLKLLEAPAGVLVHLLGPQNLAMNSLRGVLQLAEACEDWARCLSLVPHVLAALGDGILQGRADAEALRAKAMASLWLQPALEERKQPSPASREDSREAAVAACQEALAGLAQLHYPFDARLGRTTDLWHLLGELNRGHRHMVSIGLGLDEMD